MKVLGPFFGEIFHLQDRLRVLDTKSPDTQGTRGTHESLGNTHSIRCIFGPHSDAPQWTSFILLSLWRTMADISRSYFTLIHPVSGVRLWIMKQSRCRIPISEIPTHTKNEPRSKLWKNPDAHCARTHRRWNSLVWLGSFSLGRLDRSVGVRHFHGIGSPETLAFIQFRWQFSVGVPCERVCARRILSSANGVNGVFIFVFHI